MEKISIVEKLRKKFDRQNVSSKKIFYSKKSPIKNLRQKKYSKKPRKKIKILSNKVAKKINV